MLYVCPACRFSADTYLLKLQHLQNKVLCTTGNLPRHTLTRELHVAFKIPYIHDFFTKLHRQQAEVTQIHEIQNVQNTGQGKARHRKYEA
jgi:hypothetical protein